MNGQTGFGILTYDTAHLLGGLVLVLSFALLYQRRLSAIINIFALQACVLAAAAGWQGYIQGHIELYITAFITLAAKAIAIPLALHRITRRMNVHRGVETAMGVFPSMLQGAALVALAIMVVLPVGAASGASVLTVEDLALALSVVLLGLLMMIARRNAISQVIGFLSLENGLILAAVGVASMPFVLELVIAALVVVAFMIFGVFLFQIRERFDSLDTSALDAVQEEDQ